MTFPDPTVDYRRTSRRPGFETLPAPLVEAIGASLGARVVAADPPVTLGFSPAYAGRVRLDDGCVVFLKAAPASSHAGAAVAQERRVLAVLPTSVPAPRLLAGATADGWEAEAVTYVRGRVPGLPWTPADAALVHDAVLALGRVRTADLPGGLVGDDLATAFGRDDDVQSCARRLADGTEPVPPWLPHRERLPEVGRLATEAADALVGDHLMHQDLRPDNLLVEDTGRAVLLDWNWLGTGPAWADLACLLPAMAADGIDADALLAGSPLYSPDDSDAVDVFLAVIAAYMLTCMVRPPFEGGLPAIRSHQAHLARLFVAYLGRRRGW